MQQDLTRSLRTWSFGSACDEDPQRAAISNLASHLGKALEAEIRVFEEHQLVWHQLAWKEKQP